MPEQLDLGRYHDLTRRLVVLSTYGGERLRGDADEIAAEDGEIILHPDEREIARLTGPLRVIGPGVHGDGDVQLGVVLRGMGMILVTSQRLVIQQTQGVSLLGEVQQDEEVHVLSWPLDLIDAVTIPRKRTLAQRIVGSRPVEVYCNVLMTSIHLTPHKEVEVQGQVRRMQDDEVMRLLTNTVARSRLDLTPPDERQRLERVLEGEYEEQDGDLCAFLSPPDTRGDELPPHLQGRVLEREG